MSVSPNRRDRPSNRPPRRRGDDHDRRPRIVDERHTVYPDGQEEHEVVDEYGRHFWSFRPLTRQRYDMWGFGWFYWLVMWLVIIGLIVWGWGWGWSW